LQPRRSATALDRCNRSLVEPDGSLAHKQRCGWLPSAVTGANAWAPPLKPAAPPL